MVFQRNKLKGVGKTTSPSKNVSKTNNLITVSDVIAENPAVSIQCSSGEFQNSPLGMTRSGRILRKTKDCLKVMDDILKTELLIEDKNKKPRSIKTYEVPIVIKEGNKKPSTTKTYEVPIIINNNNFSISDQNKSIQTNDGLENNKEINNKTRIYNKMGTKRKSKPIKPAEAMEPHLREEVINKMKSVLSTDEEFNQDSDLLNARRFVRSRPRTPKVINKNISNGTSNDNVQSNAQKHKLDTIPVENRDVRPAKMKQVTLSNGLVLTLALVKCDYCQKSFTNKESLGRHMLLHVDLRPNMCPHCPRKFRYQSTLKIHLQRRHPSMTETQATPGYYMCQICDKAFLMEENLKLHLASHVKPENQFECLYCDKKFSYRMLLLEHEKTHLSTTKYNCYLCDMSFDCRSKLSNHIKSHKKIKDYICHYCGKEFLRLSGIKRHVKVCHGGQRIQCPICMKKLKGHLTEHMRVHEQKRPHVCNECGQRFTQSTQLTVHKRSHTGDRPYPCKICKRPFGHSNALMLHIRRHTGEKPFACAMCPMSFSQLPHMKTHMSKIHGKEHAYKCQKCEEFFKLKSDLDAHAKTCNVGERELSFEEKIQASVQSEEVEVESVMSLSRMRFLLALLLTMIASKHKLKYLGFNKRLIDDLLEESLYAMGQTPCSDDGLSQLQRLRANIQILLNGTVPQSQMDKFKSENKTTEEILTLLTGEN